MTRIQLTKLEKEKLFNNANKNKTTMSKLLNKIILQTNPFSKRDYILQKTNTATSFEFKDDVLNKIENEASKFKMSKTEIVRQYINNLEHVEVEKEFLGERISFRIDSFSKAKIFEIVAGDENSLSYFFREVFDSVYLVDTKKQDVELDNKITIAVSKTFKKALKDYANMEGMSLSKFMRAVVHTHTLISHGSKNKNKLILN